MIDIRHLRYFVTVAEERHFTRAAEKLHISQPPLSMQIKQLEDCLDVKLLERGTRHVSLTKAGCFFYQEAQKILYSLEGIYRETYNIAQGEAGILRLGFAGSVATGFLQMLIRDFSKQYQSVKFELHQANNSDMRTAMLNGKFDACLVRFPFNVPESLNCYILKDEKFLLATHKPISTLEEIEQKNYDLVIFPRHIAPELHDMLLSLIDKINIPYNQVIHATEQLTILGLVASGCGFALVPESLKLLRMKDVYYYPIEERGFQAPIALLTQRRTDKITDNFVTFSKSKTNNTH